MTVIATDGVTMAGDGLITDGWTVITTNDVKVHRLANGGLFGMTGPASDDLAFRAYLENGGDRPKLSESFTALVLNPDGHVTWYDASGGGFPCPAPQAIGAGADFARAAMDLGKTATEAVEVACRHNVGCGGTITTLTL